MTTQMDMTAPSWSAPSAYMEQVPAELWNVRQTITWCQFRAANDDKIAGGLVAKPDAGSDFGALAPAAAGLQRLRSFYHYPSNWDGERAAQPSKALLDSASEIFSLLSLHGVVPFVALSSEGQVVFSYDSDGVDGEVTVTSPGILDYYFPGQLAEYDVQFDGKSLPDELNAHLAALTA